MSNGSIIRIHGKHECSSAVYGVTTRRTLTTLWYCFKVRGFSANLSEALLEVIRQKSVEQWVCTGVGVG